MANIYERKTSAGNIRYRVQIRKKGHNFSVEFNDKQTAELFAWYKENLIDEMAAFEVPKKNMLTLEDAYELKKRTAATRSYAPKYLSDLEVDYQSLCAFFSKDIFLKDITYENIDLYIHYLRGTTVFRGGSQYNRVNGRSGREVQISPNTMRRRLTTLSVFFNEVNEEYNLGLVNPISAYMPYFRSTYLQEKK